jgi:hypothetical protein
METRTTKSKNKRWLSLLVAMMVILSISLTVFAAKPEARTFNVRWSSDYDHVETTVKIAPSNSKGTKGTITFEEDCSFDCPYKDGEIFCFDAGSVFNYVIDSMKDGGKITLTYKGGGGMNSDIATMTCSGDLYTFSGKIHIRGTNKFANIWKIDCFKKGDPARKVGFYFRDT